MDSNVISGSSSLIPSVRIVTKNGNPKMTDVYDLRTGLKIINVKRIELDVSRENIDVRITTLGAVEYEGPATIIEDEAS